MCERARPVSNAVLSTFDPCQVILDCTTLLTLLCKELMVYYVPDKRIQEYKNTPNISLF